MTIFGNNNDTYVGVQGFGANISRGIVATTFADAEGAELNKISSMCALSGGVRNAKGVIYTGDGSALVGVTDVLVLDTTYMWRDFVFSGTKPTLSANTTYLLGLIGETGTLNFRYNNDDDTQWRYTSNNFADPVPSVNPVFSDNNPLMYGEYISGVGPSVVFPESISKHIGVR